MFALQQERWVNADNTIVPDNPVLEWLETRWRSTLAGLTVTVYEPLDSRIGVRTDRTSWRALKPSSCLPLEPSSGELRRWAKASGGRPET